MKIKMSTSIRNSSLVATPKHRDKPVNITAEELRDTERGEQGGMK
jgi:hypothetical protein